jgi:hypothetical protein
MYYIITKDDIKTCWNKEEMRAYVEVLYNSGLRPVSENLVPDDRFDISKYSFLVISGNQVKFKTNIDVE